jgi:putative component of toxin-antitoxin plasmid stabilization module
MATEWRFAGLKTRSGNVLKDFLADDARLRARVDVFLGKLKVLPIPWSHNYYDGSMGDGIGELRINYGKVEYRFYGFWGPYSRQFTVIMASKDKKRQQKTINAAKKLLSTLLEHGPCAVEDYDV